MCLGDCVSRSGRDSQRERALESVGIAERRHVCTQLYRSQPKCMQHSPHQAIYGTSTCSW